MPDLIGHLITKNLQRHPFEGVSFLSATFVAIKTPLFLAGAINFSPLSMKIGVFVDTQSKMTHLSMKSGEFVDSTSFVRPMSDLFPMGLKWSFTPQDLWQTGLQYEVLQTYECLTF